MRLFRIAALGTVLGAVALGGLTPPQHTTSVNADRNRVRSAGEATAGVAGQFVTIENRDETMTLQVPATWRDISQGPWVYHGAEVGHFVSASVNLADFKGGRKGPGVFMGVLANTPSPSVSALLDTEKLDVGKVCKATGRRAYKDNFYNGETDTYAQCGSSKQRSFVTVVRSGDGSIVLLRVNVASDADLPIVNRIFETFQVLGDANEHDHGHAD